MRFGLTIITQFDYSFLNLMAKIILYLLISKTFPEKLLSSMLLLLLGDYKSTIKTKKPDSESLGFGTGLQDLVSKKNKNSLT